jgi:RNA polymerase sigma-70 factor (ECF subfamily)
MSHTEVTDKILLRSVADGGEAAYHALYNAWHKRVYTYIFAITGQRALAEEGTQDIFVIIWQRRRQLPGITNFEAWLFVIVRRHTLNLLRKIFNEKKMLGRFERLMAERGSASLDELVENAEQRKLLEQAVSRLPLQQKTVYELSQLQGLSRSEIAEKLQLSPNTVRNHLSAAMLSLRSYLQHHYSDGLLLLLIHHLLK